MSPIIDIQKRLVEVGRIRMGAKTPTGAPKKLEVFRVTSRDQSRLQEIAEVYGGNVAAWEERPGEYEVITKTAELPILLLPGQALSQWYELWSAGGCQRRCDGVTDVISDGPCVCDTESGDRKCKPTTRLSVMLPEIPGLGVWRLESHGYYAAVELSATAGLLEQATARGQMFPARLRIDQRHQIKDGKTTRYAVPVVDIDVRLPEALAGIPLSEPVGYKAIPASTGAGVTVSQGLTAVAGETSTRTKTPPVGPLPDIEFGEPLPIPVEEPEPVGDNPIPANIHDPATAQQRKKLDVLVGHLRDQELIKTFHLWKAVADARSFELEQMVELLGGRDIDGVLHWAPLRDSLTKPEASDLIERLTKLEEDAA